MKLHVETQNIPSLYGKLTKNSKFSKIVTPCLLVLIKIEKTENKVFLGDARLL